MLKKLYLLLIGGFLFYSCVQNEQPVNSKHHLSRDYYLKIKIPSFSSDSLSVVFYKTREPDTLQLRVLSEFMERKEKILIEMRKAIFQYYKQSYKDYALGVRYAEEDMGRKLSKKDRAIVLPPISSPEGLTTSYTPSVIHIPESSKCATGTFGIELDCDWDIENGLGVQFINWNLHCTSTADCAYFY